jgi:hypothetical protein
LFRATESSRYCPVRFRSLASDFPASGFPPTCLTAVDRPGAEIPDVGYRATPIDAGDAERERWYTRAACAEVLIDAGAVVPPPVCEGLLASRAKGLLQLFERKGLLPRTLKFRVALEDLDDVCAVIRGMSMGCLRSPGASRRDRVSDQSISGRESRSGAWSRRSHTRCRGA